MASGSFGTETTNSSLYSLLAGGRGHVDETTNYSNLVTSLDDLKQQDISRVDYQSAMVLHCGVCNVVWGDSLEVCGEEKHLNCVICLRVTKDVVVKDELEFRLEGHLAGCTYKSLHCSECHCFVGVVLYSTPKHLAALRSLFLLQKENINCYILRSGTMVKASSVSFEQSAISKNIKELKQEMDALEEHLSVMERRVKEQNSSEEG
ncbi:hypothetical protein MATL_G00161640 [Megalops atlanticus]|uniref:Mis18 domain-containing protein n=1 Tax=Megalops atlanticus TaxID=7932 RepID=A0A9D3PQM2_MEGAT|nr:hypothetical protein MATL_G00161640 [Megalops atlanticus]